MNQTIIGQFLLYHIYPKCLKNVSIINYYNILKVTLSCAMTSQLLEKVTPQERRFINWWMTYLNIIMKE